MPDSPLRLWWYINQLLTYLYIVASIQCGDIFWPTVYTVHHNISMAPPFHLANFKGFSCYRMTPMKIMYTSVFARLFRHFSFQSTSIHGTLWAVFDIDAPHKLMFYLLIYLYMHVCYRWCSKMCPSKPLWLIYCSDYTVSSNNQTRVNHCFGGLQCT